MRTLAIVSGGDAPGINAALAQFVQLADSNGDSVIGAFGGFPAALDGPVKPLTPDLINPWVGQAGTYLPSSREPVLSQPDARHRLNTTLASHGIDNLLLFGGNGSLKFMLPMLQSWGIACIGIPTTIDNDVPGTSLSLGFDSACNYAYQTIDGILSTAYALRGRIFVVETLGGDSGMLALAIGFGANVDAVMIKEYAYEDVWLAQRLINAVAKRGHALAVYGEGARGNRVMAETITKLAGIRVRDTRLGHAQRGSKPSHQDRTLANHFARAAFAGLKQNVLTGVTVVQNGQVSLRTETLAGLPDPVPDRNLYNLINGLG